MIKEVEDKVLDIPESFNCDVPKEITDAEKIVLKNKRGEVV